MTGGTLNHRPLSPIPNLYTIEEQHQVSSRLVTIGIPCFNGENHLQEALDSVRAQDHVDLEILVADNASTDSSRQIAEAAAAADERVTVLSAEENLGAAWNYNRLVDAASGEYFKWAAHDDVCAPTNISSCVAVLDARPEVALAFPQTAIIDGTGQQVKVYDEGLDLDIDGDVRRAARLLWRIGLCNPVFGVMRSEILRTTPLIQAFDSSDVALLAELALHGPLVQVDGRTFLRRRHEDDSRAANASSAEVAAWFSPNRAASGRTRPLVKSYLGSARRWAPSTTAAVSATAMFAVVGPLSELRWHRREWKKRRRARAGGSLR